MASGASTSPTYVSYPTYGAHRQNEPTGVGLAGLRKLCALLKDEGDKVLSGKSVFTLTSEVLSHLLVSCRRHSVVLNEQASAVPDPPIQTPTFVIPSRTLAWKTQADSQHEEWTMHVQFIKDFMLSTPNLKVIHNQSTLSFPISLHRFGNLSSLQLRRIPIHMVEGLQTHRDSLESLSVFRGTNTLKDLLESCGGDRSAPLTWPRLKAVSLMFNTITELDDSLRLLPHVEMLDLSHNCLEKCDVYLEYLGDLVHISLAYNLLTTVPSCSLSSRATLVSLVLRGNSLDQVKGIEDLTVLEELDLGENYLSDHSFLEPLVYLARLRQLQLDANPLFYHRRHRPLTASCLSRQALSVEFELDKKKLTLSEICYYGPRNVQYKKIRNIREARPSGRRSSTPERVPSPSSGIGTEPESDIVVKNPRKGKRKRLKARQAEIVETSGDFTSSQDASPGTTPRRDEFLRLKTEEARRTKEEIAELRRHYGANWIQAIEDRNIFKKDKPCVTSSKQLPQVVSKSDEDSSATGETAGLSMKQKEKSRRHGKALAVSGEPTSKSDTGDEDGVKQGGDETNVAPTFSTTESEGVTGPSDSDGFTSSERVEPANPIMAALARLAAQQSEGDTDTLVAANKSDGSGSGGRRVRGTSSSSGEEKHKSSSDRSSGLNFQNVFDNKPEQKIDQVDSASHSSSSRGRVGLGSDPSKAVSTTAPLNQSSVGGSFASSTTSQLRRQIDILSPIKSSDEGDTSALRTSTDGSSAADIDKSTSLDSSSDVHLDEEELVEPMFASLPLQEDKMILVSWSSSYLLEKDITGKLTEKLELKSLLDMEAQATPSSSGGGVGNEGQGNVKSKEVVDENRRLKLQHSRSEESVELTLKFDYVNKDRQKRFYLLDKVDSQAMTAYLQPFLDTRIKEARAKLSAVMQCLKCNRTFVKSEVLKGEKELPASCSLASLMQLQKLMDKTTFTCPRCGSSIVIDFDAATSATTSTSSQQAKSASSTPVGSYTSGEGWMDRVKQRPTAKLRRMKSADKFDPGSLPGGRLSQILARRDSSDLLDTSPSRRSSVRSSGSLSKDTRADSVSSTRERSNAFSANKMSLSMAITNQEKLLAEEGELVPVEDYFAKESMTPVVSSTQLAAMTTSLRGDSSTVGSKATVRGYSLPQATTSDDEVTAESVARPIDKNSGNNGEMADSGFASEANSQHLDHGYPGGANRQKVGTSELQTDTGDSDERDTQSSAEEGKERERRPSTASQHKHLSAMEELVNSLVMEGHKINMRESSTEHSGLGQKSMSVNAFRDLVSSSPSNNRRQRSISRSSFSEALTAGVQRSDSASSITVLSRGNSVGEEAVTFTLGTGLSSALNTGGEGRRSQSEGDDEVIPRVVSPLSSHVCSSMVSSVYESSVKTVVAGNGLGEFQVSTSNGAAATNSLDTDQTDGIGGKSKTISHSSSGSSEDLTSIYDMPRTLKKKKSSKKNGEGDTCEIGEMSNESQSQTRSTVADSDVSQALGGGNDGTDSVVNGVVSDGLSGLAVSNAQSALPALHTERGDTIVAEGLQEDAVDGEDGESNSDVETLNELDVTPQYAFHHLNHRLTLYLMMTLFEPHEEFVCKIQGEFSQYIIDESYEGIFIMSSARFYVLKITSEDHTQDPDKWLTCIEIQPIPELRYIDVGLGGQSLRLEFVTDCSSYTIVTRNRDRTAQFVDVLHTNLAKYAVSQGIASHVVVNEDVDQKTLDNLDKDVLSKVKPDQKLMLYCMGYIQRGNTDRFPVSFVISSSDICLVRACHQWPQPRLQAPITVETVGRQFVVLERQLVNNVASVNVDEASMRKISLELFNEKEGKSMHWNITMASRQTTVDFVHSLSIPWEREFGVEMDVGYLELDF